LPLEFIAAVKDDEVEKNAYQQSPEVIISESLNRLIP